jgi:hypothetical protein
MIATFYQKESNNKNNKKKKIGSIFLIRNEKYEKKAKNNGYTSEYVKIDVIQNVAH